MIKVGVSGGIGSGKTFVCKLIEKQGYPVYYADPRARDLMNQHPKIRQSLIELFGEKIYINDELNRAFLANIIFNNDEKRLLVNSIVHPIVYSDFNLWAEHQSTELVFQENALMFDNQSYSRFDKTILVFADLETRIQRVMHRDKTSREEILSRINSQGNPEEHKLLADFVIDNSQENQLEEQLKIILLDLKSLTTKSTH